MSDIEAGREKRRRETGGRKCTLVKERIMETV